MRALTSSCAIERPASRNPTSAAAKAVYAAYQVAVAAARALTAPATLGPVAGACASNADTTDDEKCVTDFVARFGLLAMRRPLTANEAKFYRDVYGADARANPAAYADVIGALLMAPQFTFQAWPAARPPSRPRS